jgi:hypothetical protein
MRTGAIFGPIHEVSRHALHTSEVLEAAIDTIKELQLRQEAVQQRLHVDLGETYREQAKDYAQFQISALKSLKLRSDSNLERLKNEIDLVCRRGVAGGNVHSHTAGFQQHVSPGQQRHEDHCPPHHDLPPRHLHLGKYPCWYRLS